MSPYRCAYPLIDLLKILAAQCIVWHHLAAYGPLSDAAALAAPGVMDWLYNDARMAVQVFLVVGGYLAARSLGRAAPHTPHFWQTLAQRYGRLVLPMLAALLVTVLCSALVRPYLSGNLVPEPPSLAQWLAHASLLHSVLGVDALSAGVWYVAIDFQLYALLAGLGWWSRASRWGLAALTAALAMLSLGWFNRHAELDIWGLYFFGAYGLGALACLASPSSPDSRAARRWYWATVLVGVVAVLMHFRERLVLALLVSGVLLFFADHQRRLPAGLNAVLRRLSDSSYALFLVHFSVLLLANALWSQAGLHSSGWALAALAATWALSVLASLAFHVQVEQRLTTWVKHRLSARATPRG